MTAREALERIEALEKFGMKLGLERIEECLTALGEPHRAYPTIHVGGTNGKGSTCVLVAEVLSETGRKVGLYTSPPLEVFGERVRVQGALLPDERVPPLLTAILEAQSARPSLAGMTQFEVITAMAFLHFSREAVDAAVVEVGLGGRLDSTNVLEPAVCAITNVGLEHAEHLGPTIADIAREKAGIVKAGVPLLTAADGAALRVIEEEARRKGAPVYALGREFSVRRDKEGLLFVGRRWRLDRLRLGLLGGHQHRNLALALAVLEVLEEQGWSVPEKAVRDAAARAAWPGRMEVFEGPSGSKGPRVLLDGAHNAHASRVLRRALEEDLTPGRILLVLGVLGDKDARSILADLVPLAHRVIFTRSGSKRAIAPAELELLGREIGVPGEVAPGVGEAVDRALEGSGPGDLVCVTGSLTTVGEARAHLRRLGWVR
jgi:dihydrofolate synthase / folylpolyglutamate synthase